MKKSYYLIFILIFSICKKSQSQDLNWGASGYVSGNLSHNFGTIGSPPSAVNLVITGTPAINSGPAITNINSAGTTYDCNNCALKTGVTFTNYTMHRIFTFTFNAPVISLNFHIYDIDGDSVVISATDASGVPQNVTITPRNGSQVKIVGNTSPSASVTGNNTTTPPAYSNQDANPNFVTFSGLVATLVIKYYMHQRDPGFPGTPSFSIGNMNWFGILAADEISLVAKRNNNASVLLQWNTESLTEPEKFVVERSTDSRTYSFISDVMVPNVSDNHFSYTDPNPPLCNAYYRIKYFTKTGNIYFSNAVLVKSLQGKEPAIAVFPNPVGNRLNVQLKKENDFIGKIKIIDIEGKKVFESNSSGKNIYTGFLKSGTYLLTVETDKGEIFNEIFVKE